MNFISNRFPFGLIIVFVVRLFRESRYKNQLTEFKFRRNIRVLAGISSMMFGMHYSSTSCTEYHLSFIIEDAL